MSARAAADFWRIPLFGAAAMLALPLFAGYYALTPLAAQALLALSLGLVWGFGGILCFGQGAFYGLGAYSFAVAAVNFGDGWSAMIVAVLIPAAAAAALGVMMFYGRLSDVYLAVVTLVFTLIIFRYLNSAAGPEYAVGQARLGGFNGIPNFPVLNPPGDPGGFLGESALYHLAFVCLIGAHMFCRWLIASPFGRVCVAVRENERRCEFLGYDARAVKSALFTVGGALAGLGGALYANWAEIVTPQLFALSRSAEAIVWVLVGGVGSLAGPMIGAFLLGGIKFLLGGQNVVNNFIALGAILIFVVLVLPKGIMPALSAGFGKLFRSARPRRRTGRRQRTGAAASARGHAE